MRSISFVFVLFTLCFGSVTAHSHELYDAIRKNDAGRVKELLENGNYHSIPVHRFTPFQHALAGFQQNNSNCEIVRCFYLTSKKNLHLRIDSQDPTGTISIFDWAKACDKKGDILKDLLSKIYDPFFSKTIWAMEADKLNEQLTQTELRALLSVHLKDFPILESEIQFEKLISSDSPNHVTEHLRKIVRDNDRTISKIFSPSGSRSFHEILDYCLKYIGYFGQRAVQATSDPEIDQFLINKITDIFIQLIENAPVGFRQHKLNLIAYYLFYLSEQDLSVRKFAKKVQALTLPGARSESGTQLKKAILGEGARNLKLLLPEASKNLAKDRIHRIFSQIVELPIPAPSSVKKVFDKISSYPEIRQAVVPLFLSRLFKLSRDPFIETTEQRTLLEIMHSTLTSENPTPAHLEAYHKIAAYLAR